jgi:hypothetical protein
MTREELCSISTQAARLNGIHRSRGAEVGVRTSVIDGLVSTVSLYYLHLDSELTFDGDSGDTQANAPSQRYGVEFQNFYKPTTWLTFNADLALTHAH